MTAQFDAVLSGEQRPFANQDVVFIPHPVHVEDDLSSESSPWTIAFVSAQNGSPGKSAFTPSQ